MKQQIQIGQNTLTKRVLLSIYGALSAIFGGFIIGFGIKGFNLVIILLSICAVGMYILPNLLFEQKKEA